MADFIKKIRTADGDKQIDYNALANLPDLSQKVNKSDIDTELDSSSTNPIANKVLAEHVEDINTALQEIIVLQEDLMTPDGNEVEY